MYFYSKRKTVACLINGFLALSTAIIVFIGVTRGAGEGQVGEGMYGLGYLKAFTNLSNLLMGFSALLMLISIIKGSVSKSLARLYLSSTVAVGLTFTVVLIFLAPLQVLWGRNFFAMYSGDMFFFHFFNPLLAAIFVIFLLPSEGFSMKDILFCEIPTFLYSVVYLFCVAVFKIWTDFYFFTFGGKMWIAPLSMCAMYLLTFAVSFFLIKLNKKHAAVCYAVPLDSVDTEDVPRCSKCVNHCPLSDPKCCGGKPKEDTDAASN